jgi:DNA-binding response OmpR family regulator
MQASSVTILTIDDDGFLCDTISDYLEEKEFACLDAQSGPEGLELFRREDPDLILLNIHMPKMSGLQVLETMARESPETPVVIIARAGDSADIAKVLRFGAWDYITKPIHDIEILLHTVQKALERSRLVRENRRYEQHLADLVRQSAAQLGQANRALEEANASLRAKDIALKEVLSCIEGQKRELAESIGCRVDEIVLPMLRRLKQGLSRDQRRLADQIERSLQEVASPFLRRGEAAVPPDPRGPVGQGGREPGEGLARHCQHASAKHPQEAGPGGQEDRSGDVSRHAALRGRLTPLRPQPCLGGHSRHCGRAPPSGIVPTRSLPFFPVQSCWCEAWIRSICIARQSEQEMRN